MIDRESLNRHLFVQSAHLYCVLDGASVPELPARLREYRVPNHCVMAGDLDAELANAAPYVAGLVPDNPFVNWVLEESFGKHWGIFAQSPRSLMEMRRHFRSLINVYDEDARSLIFRFYDPRVLNKFLPTCDTDQLKRFFGDVDAFYAEDGSNLIRFRLDKGRLEKKELN